VVLHDGWLEAALPVTTEASSRRKIHGKPNLSLFLRFFNAMAFFAGFQSARISNFTGNLNISADASPAIRLTAGAGRPAEYLIHFCSRGFNQ
jgi:hypothetical protein